MGLVISRSRIKCSKTFRESPCTSSETNNDTQLERIQWLSGVDAGPARWTMFGIKAYLCTRLNVYDVERVKAMLLFLHSLDLFLTYVWICNESAKRTSSFPR